MFLADLYERPWSIHSMFESYEKEATDRETYRTNICWAMPTLRFFASNIMAVPPAIAPARKACHLRPFFRTQTSCATACAESLVLIFGNLVIVPFSSVTTVFPFPELFAKSCTIQSGGVTGSS